MGGKMSRSKGARGERELVNLLKAHGIDAHRVPLSGAMRGYPDDVIADISRTGSPERIEVKLRAQGFKRIYGWLQDCYAVAFRGDREEWIICLRLGDLLSLAGEPADNQTSHSVPTVAGVD